MQQDQAMKPYGLWRQARLATKACVATVMMATAGWIGAAQAAPASVQTEAGWVQGVAGQDGGMVYKGLPFAQPPIGDLRWKAPAPVQPWDGVRVADQAGQACKQDGALPPAGVPNSSEDCLYLNVNVPPGVQPGSAVPVMVWIHGGAFVTGAGSQYDGSRLAQSTGAIVVTINYRLGIFGLLALDALSAESQAGNYALQDQQAALRWVQHNIAGFGGDPRRVTIFGQSAGSISVCQQLVSPSAAGLFQRAIMQSGPCTAGTLTRAKALATGNALAQKLGCAAGPSQLTCLRSKSSDEVFNAAPSIDFTDPSSLLALSPWVDGVILPAAPKDLVKQGKFNRVPMMVGNTKDEGRLFIALAYDLHRGAPLTEAEYQALVTGIAGNAAVASIITLDYSSKRLGSPDLAASALMTDALFACGSQMSARSLSAYVSTYAYEFQEEQVPPLVADPFMAWGAYHASELPFLFQSRIATTPASPDPNDVATPAQLALSARMVQYWGRFAATGDPNGGGQLNWPRFNSVIAATQQLSAAKVSTNYLGGIYSKHQCLLWDTATALGLGL